VCNSCCFVQRESSNPSDVFLHPNPAKYIQYVNIDDFRWRIWLILTITGTLTLSHKSTLSRSHGRTDLEISAMLSLSLMSLLVHIQVVSIFSDTGNYFVIYPSSVNPSTKSKSLFNKIKISTHIPLEHILANITNSRGINKMTYVAKSAFILAK
jgi:hypothetical protein